MSFLPTDRIPKDVNMEVELIQFILILTENVSSNRLIKELTR